MGKEIAECCNPDCEWSGPVSETLRWKHDTGDRLCPECHEVVEITGKEAEREQNLFRGDGEV